ncbi:hypothetical protein GORDON_84 [Arthrobacter phage Gordon]|uniref:Uncharacterized protein n=1 Tax=Arthrobacter phage Gordon TaxID=1772298 RepID=A0A0U4K7I7_9CAUD|nr:hypothetical protein FDH69_gp84 [Arthrobacter phage Gordon]ALY09059.1 hypothetical protein GORDON_84 [Arthrobacter phage Gordon]
MATYGQSAHLLKKVVGVCAQVSDDVAKKSGQNGQK